MKYGYCDYDIVWLRLSTNKFSPLITIAVISNAIMDTSLSEKLANTPNIKVAVISPNEIAELFDAQKEEFNLTGFQKPRSATKSMYLAHKTTDMET